MIVQLDWFEVEQAAMVGARRRIESRSRGFKNGSGYNDENGWQIDIEGAAAEMAFAKLAHVYWSYSVNSFRREGDVGRIQIRHTERENGSLIIRPKDADTGLFVLVVGKIPSFNIVGAITAKKAKANPEWQKDYNNRDSAFFVPQESLVPIEKLLEFKIETFKGDE